MGTYSEDAADPLSTGRGTEVEASEGKDAGDGVGHSILSRKFPRIIRQAVALRFLSAPG